MANVKTHRNLTLHLPGDVYLGDCIILPLFMNVLMCFIYLFESQDYRVTERNRVTQRAVLHPLAHSTDGSPALASTQPDSRQNQEPHAGAFHVVTGSQTLNPRFTLLHRPLAGCLI